jgi:branched-chain amino acid transport system permease protein
VARALPRRRPAVSTVVWLGAALAMYLLPLGVRSDYLYTAIINALFLSYISLCWNLAGGYAGLLSLCHATFLGIGAYTSTVLLLNFGISPWLGMLAGGALAAALAAAITHICFRYRLRGIFFAITTMVFLMVIWSLAISWDYVRASVGIWLPLKDAPRDYFFLSRVPYYYVIVSLVVLVIAVTRAITGSRIGYYLKAIKGDEDAAEALGVDTARYKAVVMAISAFLIALGGTFYAQFYLYIHPDRILSLEPQIMMKVGAMVGGAGTVIGPLVGSTALSFLDEFLRGLPMQGNEAAAIARIVYGVLLIVVVLCIPQGIVGVLTDLARKLRRAAPAGDRDRALGAASAGRGVPGGR